VLSYRRAEQILPYAQRLLTAVPAGYLADGHRGWQSVILSGLIGVCAGFRARFGLGR
jgi:hypothetical protein